MIKSNKAMLFSLSANKDLTNDIAKCLGIEVSESSIIKFANGEILCEPVPSVREKNVYVVQSTCAPVNDNLFELLIFVDALKRASAHQINVIIPFFGYARQDRKSKPRQPITSKLVADLLKTAGVHRVITVDLHAAQIQGFFSCLVDELTAIPLISSYYEGKIDPANTVVVSPDHGGVNRARRVAEKLNLPLAIIDKRRTGPNVAEVVNIVGDVEGKDCLMIDDMIDTAGSAHAGAMTLKSKGAKKISIACSHGVFSGPASQRLLDGTFDEIVTTDSIPLMDSMKDPRVKVLSLAPVIAKVIENIEEGEPVSQVYSLFNK